MWANKTLLSILILSACQLLAMHVNAASIKEMNLSQMSRMADSIVVGRCASVQSEWRGNKIFTRATIQIEQHIKGNGNTAIEVTSLGGTAIHPTLNVPVTMSVGGGLSFKQDEEVVLFTKRNRQGMNQVIGMSLGKFEVKTDQETGIKKIPFSQKKIDIMPPGTFAPRSKSDNKIIDKSLKPRDLELNEFIEKIRENVNKNN